MGLLIILALLLAGGALGCALLLLRPRRAAPLYLQVEQDAENIEWLLISLLRQAPRRQLLLIDCTSGENSVLLGALARRYQLSFATAAPPGAPLLYARRGVTAQKLLGQYAALKASAIPKVKAAP